MTNYFIKKNFKSIKFNQIKLNQANNSACFWDGGIDVGQNWDFNLIFSFYNLLKKLCQKREVVWNFCKDFSNW